MLREAGEGEELEATLTWLVESAARSGRQFALCRIGPWPVGTERERAEARSAIVRSLREPDMLLSLSALSDYVVLMQATGRAGHQVAERLLQLVRSETGVELGCVVVGYPEGGDTQEALLEELQAEPGQTSDMMSGVWRSQPAEPPDDGGALARRAGGRLEEER